MLSKASGDYDVQEQYQEKQNNPSKQLLKLIQRLRPHDIPTIVHPNYTKNQYLKLFLIFLLISSNLIAIISAMIFNLFNSHQNETNVLLLSTFDIKMTIFALFFVNFLKIFQFYKYYKEIKFLLGTKQKYSNKINVYYDYEENNDINYYKRTIFSYLFSIFILWIAMNSIRSYRLMILTNTTLINEQDLKSVLENYMHNNIINEQLFTNSYTANSNYNNGNDESISSFSDHYMKIQKNWDNIHEKYKCCGINGINDYYNLNITPPNSCKNLQNSANSNVRGCQQYIISSVYDLSTQIYYILHWFLIPIEILMGILSLIATFISVHSSKVYLCK